jgi:hypothetical protein
MSDCNRRWTSDEMRKAEQTASDFLEENSVQIADAMRSKAKYLEMLLHRVSQRNTSLSDRLEHLARISEIARLLEADADGFFDLASGPMVARILGSVLPRES